MLLLVSCMKTHNNLLYFARFCVGSTDKIANKIIQQRLLRFITIVSIDNGAMEQTCIGLVMIYFLQFLLPKREFVLGDEPVAQDYTLLCTNNFFC